MSRERPKTATLPHPSILDETLKDKVRQQTMMITFKLYYYSNSPLYLLQVDMTLTKKDLLAAVKLCNNEPGAHATIPTR